MSADDPVLVELAIQGRAGPKRLLEEMNVEYGLAHVSNTLRKQRQENGYVRKIKNGLHVITPAGWDHATTLVDADLLLAGRMLRTDDDMLGRQGVAVARLDVVDGEQGVVAFDASASVDATGGVDLDFTPRWVRPVDDVEKELDDQRPVY